MRHNLECIFVKEFGSFFRSRLAWFLLAIYVVLSMVTTFYSGYYFDLSDNRLYSFFYFQPEIFTLLLPALAMKVWADERRYGTMELLLSQPVSYPAVIIGKFLAVWAFAGLMLLFTLPLWYSTGQLIALDNYGIWWNYIFAFVAAGALAAVCCLTAAFFSSPVSAYLGALTVCLLIKMANFDTLLTKAKVSNELLIRMSQSLNFDRHYFNLISGRLTWSDGVYYLGIIIFALWMNVSAVEYKRS